MANVIAYSKTGTKHEAKVKLDAAIFDLEVSHELVGQAYRTYLANGRSAAASTLKRGQVSGGGKKPWRQKGTGRARVGSIRVPQWRHGGIVFGPTGEENYTLDMPVKMKRTAIRQALSLQANAGKIIVLETFDGGQGRVKPTVELLGKLGVSGSILLAVGEKTNLVIRATQNIAGLKVVAATYLNVFDVMNADHIIITEDALGAVNGWLKPATASVKSEAPAESKPAAPKAVAKAAAPKKAAPKTDKEAK